MFYGELGVRGGQVCSGLFSLVQVDPGRLTEGGWGRDTRGKRGYDGEHWASVAAGVGNFFLRGEFGLMSSVLREIVRFGWAVLVGFGVVLSVLGGFLGWFGRGGVWIDMGGAPFLTGSLSGQEY